MKIHLNGDFTTKENYLIKRTHPPTLTVTFMIFAKSRIVTANKCDFWLCKAIFGVLSAGGEEQFSGKKKRKEVKYGEKKATKK